MFVLTPIRSIQQPRTLQSKHMQKHLLQRMTLLEEMQQACSSEFWLGFWGGDCLGQACKACNREAQRQGVCFTFLEFSFP